MSLRLGDRLNGARHSRFVGRTEERTLFASALASLATAKSPFQVLYVFGPGGVGKTALLTEFAHMAEQAHVPATYINGRDVEPSPECFIDTLQGAMNLAPPVSPLQALASRPGPSVILIDTYETLMPLDGWLRTAFLPELPQTVLVVLAGSDPPSLGWRTDPGWQALIRFVPLRNLAPEESQVYMTGQGIPADQQPTILSFTHGHPLALSLIADTFAQRQNVRFQPEAAPDVIQTLLERLVQKVPGPAHRTALEACALVRVTTEGLLAAMLATPDAHELFEWLRGLSFVEASHEGILPHDLVREALATDLRWRNPDWHAELHRRARTYYARRVQQTSGLAQQRVIFDYVFLHCDSAAVRPFFEWQASSRALTDTMRDGDLAALEAMVSAHEGADSVRMMAHWLRRQPGGVSVFRDSQGQPGGFMAEVALHEAAQDDIDVDPATQAVWRYLQRHAPLRPGEGATLFRFWMARSAYQAVSPIQSLIFVNAVQRYLATPGLAYTFFACADPEFWSPMAAYADLARLPEADFEVGERRYGVYGHDWRVVPPMTWLALLAEREVALSPQAGLPSPQRSEPLLVLSQPEFEEAVRRALRDFSHPDLLHTNPLLRSRMLAKRVSVDAGDAERVAALRSLVEETIQSLQPLPREVKCYRALHHTYLYPAPTQELAAELLGLPFSTFRRHLTTGIARVVDILWQEEIGVGK
jgi:hypothetical protein